MEGTRIQLRPRKKARIEIIPLIDVIMFLLATFVLFTLSMNKSQAIPMTLPSGTPPTDTEVKSEPVKIGLDSGGSFYWNGELVALDEVLTRIGTLKRTDPDPKILIMGEQGAQFGPAVRILDEARKVKIEKVAFDTKAKSSIK